MNKPRLYYAQGVCVVSLDHDNLRMEHIEINKTQWKEDGMGFGLE